MITMKKLPASGADNPGKTQSSASTQAGGQSVMFRQVRLIMNRTGIGLPQTTTTIAQGPMMLPTVSTSTPTTTRPVITMKRNDELIRRLSSTSTKLYPSLGAGLETAVQISQVPTASISVNQIMTASAGVTAIAPVPARSTIKNSFVIGNQTMADIETTSTEPEKELVISSTPFENKAFQFESTDLPKASSSDITDYPLYSSNNDNSENLDDPLTPHVFVKSKRGSKRPTQRLRMRPWLLMLLNTGEIPGLQWVRKEQQIFSIPWKHASGRTWKGQDADLFERYALHTGKHIPSGQPDHKRWKANFRCALNSLHDVEELQDRSMKTGEFAHKLYRFLTKAEKKSISAKKSEKVGDRRKSDSSGGDVADLSELQNNSGLDIQKDWIFDELTGETRPPELKDHHYSFNKGDLAVSPVIDPQEIRDLLSKAPDLLADKDQQLSDNAAMETLDALPRLPFFRDSIDHTIDKVIEKSRRKNRVKSEPIIDDLSVSNVMEVDTTPGNQSDESARIAVAHSLVSFSDPDMVTEESSFAANILLDLSRLKRSSGVRERLHSFVSERMDVENSDTVSGKTDSVSEHRGSDKTNTSNDDKKVTSSTLLAGALKVKRKKPNDTDKSQTSVSHEKNVTDSNEAKIYKPLDLRIKTEPLDHGYEDSMETSEFQNQSFTNILPSLRNQFYRSSTETSESEEDEELGAELIPPPAHNSSLTLTGIEPDAGDIPQPLDLSVKVHNLVITDVSPSAKKANTSKNHPDQQNLRDSSKRNLDESLEDSEPLNLKVKKICDREPSQNNISSTTVGGGMTLNSSETQSLPLDLSIVKSEPMDDSYNEYPQSPSIAMETEVINIIGPVPDLIEAPVLQPVSSSSSSQTDFVVCDANLSTVNLKPANQVGGAIHLQGATVTPNASSNEIPKSVSAPTISFLLRQKSNLSCRFCEKNFGSSTDLSTHMSAAHAQVKTKAHTSHKKKHFCPICPKGFQKEANLAKHMKKHIRESSVQCTDCKSIFTNKEFYLKHQKDCKASGKAPCSRLKNPKEHHAREANVLENGSVLKPFQCGICNSGFEHIEDLKTHMESKRLLVRCSVCNKLFSKQSSESLETTFACSVCENEKQKNVVREELLPKPSLSTGMSLLLQAVERTVNEDAS